MKVGGFDTHAEQVESYDPTMGAHAALMYNIATAMKAFQEDLRARGIEDRVLTVTTSEFGRRIHSNGSYGTDHGTGGPMFLFGKGVQPGVVGKVPDLTKNNVEMQFDYRQVYANILKDWMMVNEDKINNDIFFRDFINGPNEQGTGYYEPLPVASQIISGTNSDFIKDRFALKGCYPNPANEYTHIEFIINATSQVNLQLLDSQGRLIKVLLDETLEPGDHAIRVDLMGFKPGMYLYKIKSGFLKDTKKLIINR